MAFDSDTTPPGAKIKVIGVGGGGSNAVNTMIKSGLDGVEFLTANTDVQSLRFSLAPVKIQLGKELTRGLGAGADPDIGRDAALEDRHEIQEFLQGADMVFITAGMGGGTGTGGASVVAQIARELGALTVAVVTKPFSFEGRRRKRHSEAGISRLRECVDTLITIPNQRLLTLASPDLAMVDAFKMADAVLVNAVKGISEIINTAGIVNVDFADVKAVMSCMGQALMGIGHASGEKRAVEAARQAIRSPLLEDVDIEGATGILINIAAGSGVKMLEINEACMLVQEAAHEDANIIFGAVIDEELGDQIRVTVIATGFPIDASEDDKPSTTKARSQTPSNTGLGRLTNSPFLDDIKAQSELHSAVITSPIASTADRSFEKPLISASQNNLSKNITNLAMIPEDLSKASVPEEVVTIPSSTRDVTETHATSSNILVSTSEAPAFHETTDSMISSESAHLARLTLDQDLSLEFPRVSPVMQASEDLKIEGARAIVDPKDEILLAIDQNIEQPIHSLGQDQSSPHQTYAETYINPMALDQVFPDDSADFAGEIDRKIDEALALAQRLNHSLANEDSKDDLDVPAFIRSNLKDLSLR